MIFHGKGVFYRSWGHFLNLGRDTQNHQGVTYNLLGVLHTLWGVAHTLWGSAIPYEGVTHTLWGSAIPYEGVTHTLCGRHPYSMGLWELSYRLL
jgi:hypothetical protein